MDRTEILKVLMPERTKQIALAWSILRQSHLSEDVYQDMLTRVFENDGIFEGPQHLRDWSWKVLRNRCYELIRQRKYQVTLLDDSILDLVDAELEHRNTSDITLRADALRICLDRLSDKSRQTIRMRFFEGLLWGLMGLSSSSSNISGLFLEKYLEVVLFCFFCGRDGRFKSESEEDKIVSSFAFFFRAAARAFFCHCRILRSRSRSSMSCSKRGIAPGNELSGRQRR